MLYKDDHADFSADPVPIQRGLLDDVEITPEKTFSYTCVKGENVDEITKEVKLAEELVAPIAKGDVVGELTYKLNGTTLGSVNLVSTQDVERAEYVDYFFKLLKRFFMMQSSKESDTAPQNAN